jgi:hypothetical protein
MSGNAVLVVVGVEKGNVEMSLREDTSGKYAQGSFEPKFAYELGLKLCRSAMEAHRGNPSDKDLQYIDGELKQVKVVVTDVQRMAMVNTVSHIVRSMLDQKRTPGQIAVEAVDAVLQETAR